MCMVHLHTNCKHDYLTFFPAASVHDISHLEANMAGAQSHTAPTKHMNVGKIMNECSNFAIID